MQWPITSYGMLSWLTGRLEEAIAEDKRALELDPLSLTINRGSGSRHSFVARQYDQAIEQERKTLELDPNFIPAHSASARPMFKNPCIRKASRSLKRRWQSPRAITRLQRRSDGPMRWQVEEQRRRRCSITLNELSSKSMFQPETSPESMRRLGEKDKAFEWLEKGYEERSIGPFVLRH